MKDEASEAIYGLGITPGLGYITGPEGKRAQEEALCKDRSPARRIVVSLVGRERQGKTSLRRLLAGEPFNRDEPSTVGIERELVDTQALEPGSASWGDWRPVKIETANQHEFVEVLGRHIHTRLENVRHRIPLARRAINSFLTMFKIGTINYCTTPFFLWAASVENLSVWPLYGLTILVMFVICGITFGRRDGFGIAVGLCHLVVLIESFLRWKMDEWFEENVDKYGTLRTFLMGAVWYGAMEAVEAIFLGMSLGLGMQCVFFVSRPPYANYFRDGNPLLKPDIHVLVVGCLFGLACVKNKHSQKVILPVVAVALAILPVFLSFVFVCGTSVGVLHGIFLFVGQSTFPVLNRAIKTVTSQPLGRHMIRHCVGILPGVFVTWLFGWALVTSPVEVSVAHVITAAVLVALNESECLLSGTSLLSQGCMDVLKNVLSQHFEAPPKSATERQPSQDREYLQARRDSAIRRDSLDRRDSPGRRDSPDRRDLPIRRDSPDRRHLPFRRHLLDGRNSPDRRHSPDRKPVQDKRVEALSSHRPRSGSIGIAQPSSVLHTALTSSTPRIVVRDFAGHPLYYSAHHVYMAGQCIYVLVFSMLEASRNFEDVLRNLIDWLQSIYIHTGFPDTRVFIVGTHRDHPDLKVSCGEDAVISVGHRLRRDIPRHFHNMLVWTDKDMPLFPVENSLRDKHDKDHRYLRHRLLQTVEELNTDKYPVRYFFFFHVLEDRRKLEVLMDSTDSLYEECQSNQCAIRDRDDFDAMLLLFKRLGEVLYFPHDNLLQSVVVLSPHAVLGLLSHLLDVPKMADRARDYVADWDRLERTGVCTRRLFEHVLHLHAQNISDESDTVLYLLKTLNLICPLGMEGGGGEAEQGFDGGVSLGGSSSVSVSGRNWTVMHQESMRLESVTHGRVTDRMIPPNIKPPGMIPLGRMPHKSTTTRERIPQEGSFHEDISRIEMRGESIRSERIEHGGISLGGDTSQYLVERGVRTQDFEAGVNRQVFTGRSSTGTGQSFGDSSNGQRYTGCLRPSVPLSGSMEVTGSVSQRDSCFVSSFAPDRGDDDHDDSDEDNNSYQGGDGSSRGARRQPVEHEEHRSLDLHNTEHFNQAASRVRSGSIEITDVEMYLVPAGLPQNLLHEHQYWDTRRGDWELLIDGLPLLPHAAFLRLLCVCAAQDLCEVQDEMGSHELTACQSRAAFTFGTSRCYKLEWLKTSDVASTYHGRLLKLVIAGDEKPNTIPGTLTPQERDNVRSAAVTPLTLVEFVWRSMTEIVRRDFNRCHLRLGVRCPCSSPHQNQRAEDEFHLLVVCDTRHWTRQNMEIPQSKDLWCCGRHVRYERGKVYEVPGGRGQQVTGVIHPDLPVLELCIGDMPHALHAQVCDLLDIPHALGKDWGALAGHLGKTVREVELLRVRAPRDPCDALLQDWARRAPDATVRDLIRVMRRMKRMDVIKTIEDFSL